MGIILMTHDERIKDAGIRIKNSGFFKERDETTYDGRGYIVFKFNNNGSQLYDIYVTSELLVTVHGYKHVEIFKCGVKSSVEAVMEDDCIPDEYKDFFIFNLDLFA